jgi:hypothetical protein
VSDLITLPDLAELAEAIGRPDSAELYRYLDRPFPLDGPDAYERDNSDRIDALWEFLDTVPAPTGRGKHDENCWRKHPLCLAEHVRQVIS